MKCQLILINKCDRVTKPDYSYYYYKFESNHNNITPHIVYLSITGVNLN